MRKIFQFFDTIVSGCQKHYKGCHYHKNHNDNWNYYEFNSSFFILVFRVHI